MLYQQKESVMNETAGKGVRLDSLRDGDVFCTRATKRAGVMVERNCSNGGIRVEFDDNYQEKIVHPGCIVNRVEVRRG